jgi:hypothetical protein
MGQAQIPQTPIPPFRKQNKTNKSRPIKTFTQGQKKTKTTTKNPT